MTIKNSLEILKPFGVSYIKSRIKGVSTEAWQDAEWNDYCDRMSDIDSDFYGEDYRNSEEKKNAYLVRRYSYLLTSIEKEMNQHSVPYMDFWQDIIDKYKMPLEDYRKQVIGE